MTVTIRTPPQRLAIIMALQEHLEGINIAEGYNNDMQGKVFRNRILIGEDVYENAPALAIIEAPKADIAVYAGEYEDWRKDYWTLLIQGITTDDKTANTADDAYYLCHDVERRLARLVAVKPGTGAPKFAVEHLLGGKITSVEIAPPIVRPPEALISSTAFFYIAVRLGIAGEVGL